jgi:hypothetical protein
MPCRTSKIRAQRDSGFVFGRSAPAPPHAKVGDLGGLHYDEAPPGHESLAAWNGEDEVMTDQTELHSLTQDSKRLYFRRSETARRGSAIDEPINDSGGGGEYPVAGWRDSSTPRIGPAPSRATVS